MPRYSERRLHWMDTIGRFEASPSSTHVHDALGCIDALRDEGSRFWEEDSPQLKRWGRCCDTLWTFLNRLSERREVKEESLQTAMREFVQEFEHSTDRMYQMLYGVSDDLVKTQEVKNALSWFGLVFRTSIYAILSTWIADKTERRETTSWVNYITGETSTDTKVTPMEVPEKYQHATRKLLLSR